MDTNSYINFPSNHYRKWKLNIPFGQFKRVRKNCTQDTTFEKQALTIRRRFEEKGYPKQLLHEAYERAKGLSQKDLLSIRGTSSTTTTTTSIAPTETDQQPQKNFTTNFITTFNNAHPTIRQILNNRWFILQNDPILKEPIPKKTIITFKRDPTIKNSLAPSRLKQHKCLTEMKDTHMEIGTFKCEQKRCKCCNIIKHGSTQFQSTYSKEVFPIKHHLTCQS